MERAAARGAGGVAPGMELGVEDNNLYCCVQLLLLSIMGCCVGVGVWRMAWGINRMCMGSLLSHSSWYQGCIICAILPSGMGARGVSSEHVENMEMFSCSPT